MVKKHGSNAHFEAEVVVQSNDSCMITEIYFGCLKITACMRIRNFSQNF